MAFSLLEGVKILDITSNLPGPLASFLLQEMGAKVTKIESPFGDVTSRFPDFDQFLNGKKERVQLDLKDPNGQARLWNLLSQADCVMCGFRPHRLKAMGLDEETVFQANPGMIYAHITGFPGTGPDVNRPGHDLTYMAQSGMLQQLFPGTLSPTAPVADITASLYSAMVISAAIANRSRTGKGTSIEINLLESSFIYGIVHHTAPELSEVVAGQTVGYHIYPTKDSCIAIGAVEPKFFNRLVKGLGMPEFSGQGHLIATDEEPVYRELKKQFKAKDTSYWISWAEEQDIPVAELKREGTEDWAFQLPIKMNEKEVHHD